MEESRARELLAAERTEVERLLKDVVADGLQDLRRLEAQLEPHLNALPGISPQQPRAGEPARAGAATTTPATPPRR